MRVVDVGAVEKSSWEDREIGKIGVGKFFPSSCFNLGDR